MNLNIKLMTLGLAGLAATGLQAQEASRFDVGFGVAVAAKELKDITNSSFPAVLPLDFGVNGMLAATDIPFRAALGVKVFPGKSQDGVKNSMINYQLGGDLFIKTPVENLRLTAGLSVNKWRVKSEAMGVSTTESIKGVKLGARIGLDFVINAHWTTNFTFEVVELGTGRYQYQVTPARYADQGINPSWFQLGARYRF